MRKFVIIFLLIASSLMAQVITPTKTTNVIHKVATNESKIFTRLATNALHTILGTGMSTNTVKGIVSATNQATLSIIRLSTNGLGLKVTSSITNGIRSQGIKQTNGMGGRFVSYSNRSTGISNAIPSVVGFIKVTSVQSNISISNSRYGYVTPSITNGIRSQGVKQTNGHGAKFTALSNRISWVSNDVIYNAHQDVINLQNGTILLVATATNKLMTRTTNIIHLQGVMSSNYTKSSTNGLGALKFSLIAQSNNLFYGNMNSIDANDNVNKSYTLTGTITVNNSSQIIGSGTSFLKELSIGDVITVNGFPSATVMQINDDTHASISPRFVPIGTYTGQTGYVSKSPFSIMKFSKTYYRQKWERITTNIFVTTTNHQLYRNSHVNILSNSDVSVLAVVSGIVVSRISNTNIFVLKCNNAGASSGVINWTVYPVGLGMSRSGSLIQSQPTYADRSPISSDSHIMLFEGVSSVQFVDNPSDRIEVGGDANNLHLELGTQGQNNFTVNVNRSAPYGTRISSADNTPLTMAGWDNGGVPQMTFDSGGTTVQPRSSAGIGMWVNGAVGQTGDLQQWQTNGFNVAKMSAQGRLSVYGTNYATTNYVISHQGGGGSSWSIESNNKYNFITTNAVKLIVELATNASSSSNNLKNKGMATTNYVNGDIAIATNKWHTIDTNLDNTYVRTATNAFRQSISNTIKTLNSLSNIAIKSYISNTMISSNLMKLKSIPTSNMVKIYDKTATNNVHSALTTQIGTATNNVHSALTTQIGTSTVKFATNIQLMTNQWTTPTNTLTIIASGSWTWTGASGKALFDSNPYTYGASTAPSSTGSVSITPSSSLRLAGYWKVTWGTYNTGNGIIQLQASNAGAWRTISSNQLSPIAPSFAVANVPPTQTYSFTNSTAYARYRVLYVAPSSGGADIMDVYLYTTNTANMRSYVNTKANNVTNWVRTSGTPSGAIMPFAGVNPPMGWSLCDGHIMSRVSASALYNAITVVKGTNRIGLSSTGTFTNPAHGLITGDRIEFSTTGTLPTGVLPYTNYYVIVQDANSFWVATNYAKAIAGVKTTLSGSPSGTHTLRYVPYGTSTSAFFFLPDFRGASIAGAGTGTGYAANETINLGAKNDDQMQGHYHSLTSGTYVQYGSGALGAPAGGATLNGVPVAVGSPTTDGSNGTPRTGTYTRGKVVGVNFIIKQ